MKNTSYPLIGLFIKVFTPFITSRGPPGGSLQGWVGSKFWIPMMVGPRCWGSYVKDSVVIAPFDTGLYVNTCPLANVQEDSDNHISLLRVAQVTGWKTVTILGVDIRRKWKIRLSNWNFRMQDKIFDMFFCLLFTSCWAVQKFYLYLWDSWFRENIVWFTKQDFTTNRRIWGIVTHFCWGCGLCSTILLRFPSGKKYTPEV